MADGWALSRIVDNLIANGIKFTEAGGSVEVSAGRMPEGVAAVVKDTGTGMDPEVLRQIGEPFYQADTGAARRFEGMGTGLALSLRLAEAIGARLSFNRYAWQRNRSFPHSARCRAAWSRLAVAQQHQTHQDEA